MVLATMKPGEITDVYYITLQVKQPPQNTMCAVHHSASAVIFRAAPGLVS